MKIAVISNNRKAYHEYTVSDTLEAGIVLTGTEVKSARAGKVNLSDGWVEFVNGEAFLQDVHIGKYSHGTYANHLEVHPRKLLLNRKELVKLEAKIAEKGYTVVPLKMYFLEQYLKVEIGVAKGKKLHDKRDSSKQRDAGREIQRAMRQKG